MNCTRCGVPIQLSTAAENDGLCAPCKTGTRESIELAKKRRAIERVERNSPAAQHWRWLVQCVQDRARGFERLSPANLGYFAVGVLEGDVYNGGFDQYFHNSSADHYSKALETLFAVGASTTARLVVAAKELLFGEAHLPATTARRQQFLLLRNDERARRRGELERLDADFWRDPDDLDTKIKAFALRHALQSDF